MEQRFMRNLVSTLALLLAVGCGGDVLDAAPSAIAAAPALLSTFEGAPTCEQAPCAEAARTATEHLARWALPVLTCCRDDGACGLMADPGAPLTRPAASGIVTELVSRGCSEPSALTSAAASYAALADALLSGTPLTEQDGGVALSDGGTIVLDPACPDLDGDTGLFTFHYPGCCLPHGECGNSNHTLPGLEVSGESFSCLSLEVLAGVRSPFIPVPEQPTACTPPAAGR